jgi:lipopolysaccharide/colanic/teichoic acid biosynthesis glycosyltransferase
MEETTYLRPSPVWLRAGEETTWDTMQDFQLIDAAAHAEVRGAEERVFSFRYLVLKRSLDFGCATILSAIVLPAAVVIAVGIKLTSKGPVIYREQRIGRHGVPFTIFKFRTMHTKAELSELLGKEFTREQLANWRTDLKTERDPRITAVGQFLRRWSLDELPQLFNVIRGDMSLVGPRPVVQAERDRFGSYGGGLYDLALPGISGLWQISGRSDLSFDKRVHLDAQYAREWGISRDLWILLRTLPAVLSKRGAY